MENLIEIANKAIEIIAEVLKFILGILPSSPLKAFQNVLDNDILGFINWFLPISEMIVILELWGTGIILWYLISIPLCIIKAHS